MSITTDRSSTPSCRFSTRGNEMKPLFWILACGLTVAMLQYSLFKENGEPRQISLPMAVAK